MSTVTSVKIKEAGDRLLQQASRGVSVKLTFTALAQEAGLSRATINKPDYIHERDDFKKKVATFESTGKTPKSQEKGLVYENEQLLKEVAMLRSENKELHVLVKAYAGKLQVNSLSPDKGVIS